MKIYIAGKITGLDTEVAFGEFKRARLILENIYPDSEIINPMELPHNHDKTWESYMR
jgi:hypothetical protein